MARAKKEELPWDEDLKTSAKDGGKTKEVEEPKASAKRAAKKAAESVEEAPLLKLPKSDAKLADMWFEFREQRLAKEKEAAKLEAKEKFCKAALIDRIPKSEATGVAGSTVRVSIVKKKKVRIENWDLFYAHVKKTGDFALLNKAVNATHVEELWEAKKKVPGAESFDVVDISYSRL